MELCKRKCVFACVHTYLKGRMCVCKSNQVYPLFFLSLHCREVASPQFVHRTDNSLVPNAYDNNDKPETSSQQVDKNETKSYAIF